MKLAALALLLCAAGAEESVAAVVKCPSGAYYYGQVGPTHYCVKCPAGTFAPRPCNGCAKGVAARCNRCPAGQTSAIGATTCKAASTCTTGRFISNSRTRSCKDCPTGKWQSRSNQRVCHSCPAGTYQPRTRMGGCYRCPIGEYTAVMGKKWCDRCNSCPSGRFGTTARMGSRSKSSCECKTCGAGKFVLAGYTRCYNCPAGRFNFKTQQAGCYKCPAGQFQAAEGRTSCNPCPAGRYQGKSGEKHCTACPPGLKAVGGAKRCTKSGFEHYRAHFAVGDSQKAPPSGWSLMSAVQLNQFAASMRHYYDLHGGLGRLGNKSWRSTGCCFATPTGRLWTGKSATDGSFVFPSNDGSLSCNPSEGYGAHTYRLYGEFAGGKAGTSLATTTKFFEKSPSGICAAQGNNPGIFMRLEPTSETCTENTVDYGRWRVCVTPPSVTRDEAVTVRFRLFDQSRTVNNWSLMEVYDMEKYRTLLQAHYRQRGGLWSLGAWAAKSCCVMLKGGYRLAVDRSNVLVGTAKGQCGHVTHVSASAAHALTFRAASGLRRSADSAAKFTAIVATGMCAKQPGVDNSPGIFMQIVPGVAPGAHCEVVNGQYTCVEAQPATGGTSSGPAKLKCNQWGSWGPCSASCAGGSRTRVRPRTEGKLGAVCTLKQYGGCNVHRCPIDCKHATNKWSPWSTCSKSCGEGQLTRTRAIATAAAHGGKDCEEKIDTRPCTVRMYCPVDCQVSQWGGWTKCSKDCGGGQQKRHRAEVSQANHGGRACPRTTESRHCNEQHCPVDCKVAAWGRWGACSVTCGAGTITRVRAVLRRMAYGGKACTALKQTQACKMKVCDIDCRLGNWGSWGACTRSCAGGLTLSRRSVVRQRTGNGKSCTGALVRSKPCNAHKCAFARCHNEHVRCHYDHHHIVITHGKKYQDISGAFTCASTGGYRAKKLNIRHEVTDACRAIKHKFGGRCTPTQEFVKGIGHVYGFRLGSMSGLKLHSMGFPSSEMRTKQGVADACRLAFGAPYPSAAEVSDKSFAVVTGSIQRSMLSLKDALEREARNATPREGKLSSATTYLECYFTNAKVFKVDEALTPTTNCQCTCTHHPCCSKKGWTLANKEIDGNRFDAVDQRKCCSLCTNHPGCTSWTYDGVSKTCSLRTGQPSWVERAAYPHEVAGTKSGGEQCVGQ